MPDHAYSEEPVSVSALRGMQFLLPSLEGRGRGWVASEASPFLDSALYAPTHPQPLPCQGGEKSGPLA